MRTKLWTLLGAIGVAVAASACGENLDSGPVCPALCPGPVVELRETVIEPVVLDTTIGGLPPLGSETTLLLADDPGTVVSYGVVRFDSLVTRFNPPDEANDTTTSPITELDSVFLRLKFDTAGVTIPAPVTLELYDVDAATDDTATSQIAALVASGTPIADTTIAADALGDSLRLAIPRAFLQAKVDADARVRLAIRATTADPAANPPLLRVFTSSSGFPPLLIYDPLPSDTAVRPVILAPRSDTPDEPPGLAARLRDYTVFAEGTPTPPADLLAVGGLPAHRTLFRFEIPSSLIDSTTIVRATLILYPTGEGAGSDTLRIIPMVGISGTAISDPTRQALLALDVTSSPFLVDTLKVLPGSTDSVTVDIASVVQNLWKPSSADTLPRTLVLRAAREGSTPGQVVFYSAEAANAALKPRLRIRYIPAVEFGLP